MQNPLLTLRLLIPYTQQELADKTGVSKQYISTAEKGMQTKLNKAYMKVLLNLAQIDDLYPEELEREYFSWQVWKRQYTLSKYDITPVAEIAKIYPGRQPSFILFKKWRETYWETPYSFCEDFCLKQYDVQRYENGSARQMPRNLVIALEPLGFLEGFNYEAR